jgi:hypothetical protein
MRRARRGTAGENDAGSGVASQGLVSHHYWVVDGQLEFRSVPFRYVRPSELDLMARLAGMTLRALERLDPCALHKRQHESRVGLGEDCLAAMHSVDSAVGKAIGVVVLAHAGAVAVHLAGQHGVGERWAEQPVAH